MRLAHEGTAGHSVRAIARCLCEGHGAWTASHDLQAYGGEARCPPAVIQANTEVSRVGRYSRIATRAWLVARAGEVAPQRREVIASATLAGTSLRPGQLCAICTSHVQGVLVLRLD